MMADLSKFHSATVILLILVTTTIEETRAEIKIASFNIQDFSPNKLQNSRQWVRDVLYRLFCQYDVVFVMEITQEPVVRNLVRELNFFASQNPRVCRNQDYGYFASDALGPETCRAAQEIYAYVYSAGKVQLNNAHEYNGPESDKFARPPYVVTMVYPPNSSNKKSLLLMGLHATANNIKTKIELEALYTASLYYKNRKINPINDGFLMGDFNADCRYLSTRKYNMLKISNNYKWIISPQMKTNILGTCSYDKFVATSQNAYSCVKPESVKVDTFYDLIREILQPPASMPEECVLALVKTVSDHYPIAMDIDCT